MPAAAIARLPQRAPWRAQEPPRYLASEALLGRARRVTPLGDPQLPFGVSPYFAASAKGAMLWDVDGHGFVDFCNALGAVTLGYADPDVNAAAQGQIAEGGVFSLSHRLEAEVAERICDMVPCAEAVRFGHSGADAAAWAVQAARACTGRDHVLTCGQYGSIGTTTPAKGAPTAVRDLTHAFAYDDLPGLEALLDAHASQVAAIVMEPMNLRAPSAGYLAGVRALADAHGAVLIFDETVTGFRFDRGGAQALFGVTPDLAIFGRGLANGFPLSAVAGTKPLMAEVEAACSAPTLGGEAVSLAAAKAVLDKIEREPVIETLRIRGAEVQAEVTRLLAATTAGRFAQLSGDPTWSFLSFDPPAGVDPWALKTLFLQEVFARGLFTLGAHSLSYAHGDDEISHLVDTYEEVFPILVAAVKARDPQDRLRCLPLRPAFEVS